MSEPRRFSFLVNPSSGGGAAATAVVPVARLLREAGATVEVTYSPGPQAVQELARAAVAAGDVVVAVGGDGMVSSLAGVMSELTAGGGCLGLVPAGRGNDFARMLEMPSEPELVARRLLEAEPRLVDLVDCAGTVVAGSVYAGVDARAAAMVARMRRLPAPLQYPWAAVRALTSYRPNRYRLTVDGTTREVDAATVVVANSAYYGSGMKIAPDADLSDGHLQVVVVGAGSRRELVTAFPKIYDGSHVRHPKVAVLVAREVRLAALSLAPVPLGGDGEDLGVLPSGRPDDPSGDLAIKVRPSALRVV